MSEEAPGALQQRLEALPAAPGVYLFHGAGKDLLYVGKAQNLRARVRSYFARGDERPLTHFLVARIRDVEVVVTANVKEALLLENQLIKKHRPRFNVRLRDDKNYLALRIDPREAHPRFTETRRFARDGAVYFGPYTSSTALRETRNALQRIFPLRTCSDSVFASYRRRGRPCLEHSIGRCAAPCCGRIDEPAYRELVDGAVLFLRGRTSELVRELRSRMRQAADAERFEEAARVRDRIDAIERTVERQAMVSTRFVDRDVFGLARDGLRLEVQSLHVRKGKLVGGTAYDFSEVRLDDAEALGSFLAQYYDGERDVPQELLLPLAVEGAETLLELLRERSGRAVELLVPRRGERRRLVEMAERNAALSLGERSRKDERGGEALASVAELLRLPGPPARIECYDVSHLQGSLHVASRVVFEAGEPAKAGYRRYKLREAAAGDDYGAMREVLRRRFLRVAQEPAPDLVLLDGGKGQLNAVRAVLEDLELEGIGLAALAKERDDEAGQDRVKARGARVKRHGGQKREKLFLPGVKDPLLPAPDSPALLLLQRVRDESHRFAIRYHRMLRRKSSLRSILEELPGIGPAKRRALLRTLGSLERIRSASEAELLQVPGISRADALRIHRFFAPAGPAAAPAAELPPEAPVKPAGPDSDSEARGEA